MAGNSSAFHEARGGASGTPVSTTGGAPKYDPNEILQLDSGDITSSTSFKRNRDGGVTHPSTGMVLSPFEVQKATEFKKRKAAEAKKGGNLTDEELTALNPRSEQPASTSAVGTAAQAIAGARPSLPHPEIDARTGDQNSLTPEEHAANKAVKEQQVQWDANEARKAGSAKSEINQKAMDDIVASRGPVELKKNRQLITEGVAHLRTLRDHVALLKAKHSDNPVIAPLASSASEHLDAAEAHLARASAGSTGNRAGRAGVQESRPYLTRANQSLLNAHDLLSHPALLTQKAPLVDGGVRSGIELNRSIAEAQEKSPALNFKEQGAAPGRIAVGPAVIDTRTEAGAEDLKAIKKAVRNKQAGVDQDTGRRIVRTARTGTPRLRKEERDAREAAGESRGIQWKSGEHALTETSTSQGNVSLPVARPAGTVLGGVDNEATDRAGENNRTAVVNTPNGRTVTQRQTRPTITEGQVEAEQNSTVQRQSRKSTKMKKAREEAGKVVATPTVVPGVPNEKAVTPKSSSIADALANMERKGKGRK